MEVGEQVGSHGPVNVEGALHQHHREASQKSQELRGGEGHVLYDIKWTI